MIGRMKAVDVAVIGAGTAGINAQKAAAKAGASAIMFDPGPLGTTCARVGCMPSKLLIASAEVAHSAAVAKEFGIEVAGVSVDGEAVMARVQRMRDGFVGHTLEGIERTEGQGGLVREAVRFKSQTEIECGAESYRIKAAVIATGSTPWIPPPYRALGDRMLTTNDIFELPTLPKSLLVVGAGVIGVELALAFAKLGVRVTVVELEGRLAGLSDPVVRDCAYEMFSEVLDLHTNHEFVSVERDGDEVHLQFVDDTGTRRDERYEFALVATGRRPNLEGLGLEVLGLGTIQELLRTVNPATGQVGDSNLFMAGDVTGTMTLMHEAGYEGRVSGQNAAKYPEVAKPTPRLTPLGIVFSDPQIALVGPSFDELPEDVLIGEIDFAKQSRARVMGKARGVSRIYASPVDGRLLGATLLGPDAEHLGHLLAWTIEAGKTVKEALAMPYYHPTVEEGLRTALVGLAKQRKR